MKGKDPKIYDNCNKFFQENEQIQTQSEEKSSKSKPKKETPMFLKDYERKVIIEKEGYGKLEICINKKPTKIII